MKRAIALGLGLLILTSVLLYDVQNKAKEVPLGVDPEMWVAVADNFGIVLTKSSDKGFEAPWRTSERDFNGEN